MKYFAALLTLFLSVTVGAQPAPVVAFTVKEKDLIPEGIASDPAGGDLFLGSIYKRKIVRIAANGVASDFTVSGQDSLLQVLGMTVDGRGRLWACNNSPEHDTSTSISNIHVYDTRNGRLLAKHTLRDEKRHLFNDVHVTAAGDAYVTDSEAGAIYRIRENGEPEEFVRSGTFRYPNGITGTPDGSKIIVGTAGGIFTVDIATGAKNPLPNERFYIIGTDGLYWYRNSLIGIQNVTFPEAVVRFELNSVGSAIERISFLASNHSLFDVPTTGAIAGDHFYFIANSQLLQLIGNKGRLKDPARLKETVIMKIRLN